MRSVRGTVLDFEDSARAVWGREHVGAVHGREALLFERCDGTCMMTTNYTVHGRRARVRALGRLERHYALQHDWMMASGLSTTGLFVLWGAGTEPLGRTHVLKCEVVVSAFVRTSSALLSWNQATLLSDQSYAPRHRDRHLRTLERTEVMT
jgi:hypothetical protein